MIYEIPALTVFTTLAVPAAEITPEVTGCAVLEWLNDNASRGNTTVHEAGVVASNEQLLEGYAAIAADASCRASISLMYDSMLMAEPYKKYGFGAQATQIPDTMLTIYGMKIVGDGSNQARTAKQTVRYLDGGPEDIGETNYEPAKLKEMVADIKEHGWPVLIHCNGDATLDDALNAIEAAYGPNPATGVNRIEHCTITRPEQITRMARLGVQPSFLMNHVYFYGKAYRDTLFGADRAARMDPAGDFVRRGLPFTLHTDAPCSNVGALQLVQTAVTRKCVMDKDNPLAGPVGPDQAVSLTEALRAVTVYAAGQIGRADQIGSLEVGKFADLTILETDPYKVDPNEIMYIPISQTWVGGKKKYDRGSVEDRGLVRSGGVLGTVG